MNITYEFTAKCEFEVEKNDTDYFRNLATGQLENDIAVDMENLLFDRVSIDNLKVTIKGGE